MRIFRIDYTNADNMFPDGDIVGYYGEHNATQLVITPPQEMTDCADVASYRIAFGLTNCRAVRSETLEKTEAVSFLLFAQITRSETISVQLEGYGTDGNLVMKSETAKKLKFSDSVSGTEITANGKASDLSTEVSANTAARHTHENAATLGALGESDGQLTYNGNAVGERSFITRPFETLDVTDILGFQSISIVSYVENDATLAEITDIKTIRIKYNGEWIDIHKMAKLDDIPYILNLCGHYSDNIGGYVFAMVTFPGGDYNTIMSRALAMGGFEDVEIDYYPNGGVTNEQIS
ncbi:MAG: hypothetical protein IJ264_04670 [Clostridia bacterium]|nr:hypothetical protein [Clostridia bacterium]